MTSDIVYCIYRVYKHTRLYLTFHKESILPDYELHEDVLYEDV